MKAILLALLVLPIVASAQISTWDQTNCYSWGGGNFSSGGFSKCRNETIPPAPKPKPAPVALPAPVAQSPIMMPMSAPPKPIIKPKPKPKVKMICKPA